jgi:arginyl-tRNA--protein-N-Asp/Glu arginylyltransferase
VIPLRDEGFFSWRVSPGEMDRLWSEGWRHFGPMFYRYSRAHHDGRLMDVRPLRVSLDRFRLSRSQRRVLARNRDLTVRVRPTLIDETRRVLFDSHKKRFAENVPEALEDFLGPDPARGPCLSLELGVYRGPRLVAASYFDVGHNAVSSVYAFFDLEESRRSPGILTMLHEITWARDRGCRFYYPGYAYAQPSHYDYKKQFAGIEWFDWQSWQPIRPTPPHRDTPAPDAGGP